MKTILSFVAQESISLVGLFVSYILFTQDSKLAAYVVMFLSIIIAAVIWELTLIATKEEGKNSMKIKRLR